MSANASWHEGNARYLAAAMTWLRLRLERMADGSGGESEAMDDATSPPGSLSTESVQIAPRRATKVSRVRVPATVSAVQEIDAVAQAEQELALCESQMDPPPALVLLARRLGLSRFEQALLLLCVGMELDTRTAERCAHAQSDVSRAYPTFALALALFPDAAWDVMSPERPLRHWRLIDIDQSRGQRLTMSPLRADERIVNHIKGLDHLDERLMPMLAPLPASHADALQPSQQASVDHIVNSLAIAAHAPQWPAIQLLGSDAPSKRLVAQRAAAHFGRHLYKLSADLLPANPAELEAFARLWQRECVLMPLALFVECGDGAAASNGHTVLSRLLSRSEGLFFIDARELLPQLGRSHIAVDVAKPTAAEQRAAWSAALEHDAADNPAALAAQFNLDVETIHRIVEATLTEVPANDKPLSYRLWDACKSAVRPGLDALAHRIDAKAMWDDIVLPTEQLALLRQISDQVRCRSRVYDDWGFAQKMNRGLGISALFEGASGVGKTMAAEVIANDLRLNLYRIDLSTVISKYIGETEGNLRRLFDAAEDGGAILFFDECDALFGKRSEVKDSHDRYANIETNYLLQRIEAYRGLAILATNMKSALDAAFVRRLRFILNFQFPETIQRQAIWRKAFPVDVPCGRLDFERLGRFSLAGGSIHSAALCAAFFAAHEGTPVTMHCLLAAVRTEFVKLGRPINESDFRVPLNEGMAA